MSILKKLAGQTAIYGISSMVGRFLFFLLTPIYTNTDIFDQAEFGVITELYTYVVFAMIILTYGMETSYFRFSTLEGNAKERVFSTAITSILATSGLFLIVVWFCADGIAGAMKYNEHPEYIRWLALILVFDAVTSLAMAKLRSQNNAFRFAVINLSSVIANIGLILFFLVYCALNHKNGTTNALIDAVYNPEIGVGYVFIANLIASGLKLVLLLPDLAFGRFKFDLELWKKMMPYALPLLVFGLAGSINETLDRIMLKEMTYSQEISKMTIESSANQTVFESSGSAFMFGLQDKIAINKALVETGIYGAVYKIAMIVTIFLQAFRYASEPFFFNQEKDQNSKKIYARVMTYFVIAVAFIFLVITLYLHIFKHFIGRDYWDALFIVPILLLANVSLGIYWNLNIWFKLSKQTNYGLWLGLIGAGITIVGNLIFIPYFGYVACAWVTLICYLSLIVASYLLGQKNYYIPYNLRKIVLYLGLALLFYFISVPFNPDEGLTLIMFGYHTLLMLLFIGVVIFLEKPKKTVISKA